MAEEEGWNDNFLTQPAILFKGPAQLIPAFFLTHWAVRTSGCTFNFKIDLVVFDQDLPDDKLVGIQQVMAKGCDVHQQVIPCQ
jgi:hypothetical protein